MLLPAVPREAWTAVMRLNSGGTDSGTEGDRRVMEQRGPHQAIPVWHVGPSLCSSWTGTPEIPPLRTHGAASSMQSRPLRST